MVVVEVVVVAEAVVEEVVVVEIEVALLLFYELIDASFIDVCEKYDKFVCVIFVVQLKHLK